ncbi:MAG: ASCH domain-containing protein [Eubacteriales bacterium]|nr:ASCH domain-containing protein [Eubacteriales bacterium]
MNNIVEEYWEKFCHEKSIEKETPHEAWGFGNTKEMADELASLVYTRIKTATTSAYELYGPDEHIPQVGDYNIILDGSGNPVCITQTKAVQIIPYNQITPEHVWHEGEGDRSYQYWRKIHDDFFEREYKECGQAFYEEAPMICEVFEKVY